MNYTAKVISVIETTLLVRGEGVAESPVRCITQYWSTEGKLLAEVDPCVEMEFTPEVRAAIYALIEREIFTPSKKSPATFFNQLAQLIGLRRSDKG